MMFNYRSIWLLLLIGLIFAVSHYFFLWEAPLIFEQNITCTEPPQTKWELLPLIPTDSTKVDAILLQPFSYLGEGGQMIAFVSADQRYVLKFFKFQRFRPSFAVTLLQASSLFPNYCQRHISKRSSKKEAAFQGCKLAYEKHREESGIVHMRLNAVTDTREVTLLDDKGGTQAISLNNVPYVLQEKVELLGPTLAVLLEQGDVESVKWRLTQLLKLYSQEYSKGIYDLDHGIMHNIGCTSKELIHLDFGKLVYDPSFTKYEVHKNDWLKVCAKVKQWVKRKYPQYATEIAEFIDNHLQMSF